MWVSMCGIWCCNLRGMAMLKESTRGVGENICKLSRTFCWLENLLLALGRSQGQCSLILCKSPTDWMQNKLKFFSLFFWCLQELWVPSKPSSLIVALGEKKLFYVIRDEHVFEMSSVIFVLSYRWHAPLNMHQGASSLDFSSDSQMLHFNLRRSTNTLVLTHAASQLKTKVWRFDAPKDSITRLHKKRVEEAHEPIEKEREKMLETKKDAQNLTPSV